MRFFLHLVAVLLLSGVGQNVCAVNVYSYALLGDSFSGTWTADHAVSVAETVARLASIYGAQWVSCFPYVASDSSRPAPSASTGAVGSVNWVGIANGAGATCYSVGNTVTAYGGTPSAPLNVVVLMGVAGYSAEVYFGAPASPGGTITSYTVTGAPGAFEVTGSSSPLVVNGLTAGVQYGFTVHATNEYGAGVESVSAAYTGRSVDPDRPVHTIVDWVGGFGDSAFGVEAGRALLLVGCSLMFGLGWVAGK
jgi:hypothetical protein